MNPPARAGDRYRCFVLVRPDLTYGGPYGATSRWPIWECEDCGHRLTATYQTFQGERRWSSWDLARMADHHECGHAPCPRCGQLLLRRKDGTPRQHAHNRCPGKTPGDKIELEFVKNMTERGYR
jgi:hypothetical protein